MREENDGHREQSRGQAVRTLHQELQEATPPLMPMIEGHGNGLPTPRPLPKGEDDGQCEQAKQLWMLEDHETASMV
jgi:hypothetical protein